VDSGLGVGMLRSADEIEVTDNGKERRRSALDDAELSTRANS